ncbi:Acyl-CoA synthetase (AMP-forming)/AMP-acid ligase II [Shimia gijangensis]|uniref:Acyl-CoA synthetase (AMP-forming)/AMP-acid ligase II n=1 Tax=Shimia gijangensis TaxID=1470563 RepID=A0A1M6REX8_9RHOB|nr:class I adenylate-forming enzyme family protein [Shimia gijangensis]SHK30946.1 Acyl-CoA synthetase (AMP-forming)/AMP-acid ligase II [Shimia gijangensis]
MFSLFDQGRHAPAPSSFNMAAYVLAHADELSDKTALAVMSVDEADLWSYGRLKSAILRTGTGLLQAGLEPGDRVLMRIGNAVEFPIAYLGAIAVGLVPVPTSSQLTEPEVAKMIAELSPSAILRDPDISCPVTPEIPQMTIQALEGMRDLPPAEFHMGDPERTGYIIYTSGTSGVPRAVCHAHRAIWARQMMHQGWSGLQDSDRLMHAGAFNWTYTLGTGLMDPWSMGATALIPAKDVNIASLPHLLKTHQVTIFAAAPGVYRKMLSDHPDIHLPDLRHGLSAGEKLSEAIQDDWFEATGTSLFEAYGMSECSTFISASPSSPAHPGTFGKPQNGRRIALVDENGAPVHLGEEGTIAIDKSDPGMMLGYWNAAEDTASRFIGDWFLTGDRGTMNADFYIHYSGRADDMMNAGGYRVSPIEVEAALSRFPDIQSVGVTDVEIKQDVRVIAAFYTSDEPLDETALSDYAEQTLARYKQPRLLQRLDALPTNPNGKLSRRALRQHFEAHR